MNCFTLPWAVRAMKKNIIKNTFGFSLIEAILGMSILSVGLLGGMIVLQNAVMNTVNNDCNTVAVNLARDKMEEILADKKFLGFVYVSDASNYPTEQLTGNYSGYQREIVITEVNKNNLNLPQAGSGLSRIEVYVRWGTGYDHEVFVSTLLASYRP